MNQFPKTILTIVFTAVVVAAVSVGGTVWYYQNKNSDDTNQKTNNTVVSSNNSVTSDPVNGKYNTKNYDYDVVIAESFPVQMSIVRTNVLTGQKETIVTDAQIRESLADFKSKRNLIFVELSEPQDSQYVYYVAALADSDDPGKDLYKFDTNTETFTKMSVSSEVSWLGGRAVNASGTKLVLVPTVGETGDKNGQTLYCVDLAADAIKKIVTLSGNESLNGGESGGLSTYTELSWKNETEVQYGVFDTSKKIPMDPKTGQSLERIATRTVDVK